jgi:hypothetical protein
MSIRTLRHCSLTLIVLASGGEMAWSMDEFVAGPRALALGGADVESRVDDADPSANPALLAQGALYGRDRVQNYGAPKGWGTGLWFDGGAQQRNDLNGVSEALKSVDIQRIGQDGIRDANDVRGLLRVADELTGARLQETALWAFGDAGASARFGSFAFGARLHYEAAAYVASIDLTNLGTGVVGTAAANQINASGAPQDGTIGVLTTTERDKLYSAFGGTGAFNAASPAGQAVLRLDYAMRQRGLNGDRLANVVNELSNAFSNTGFTLDRNSSSAIIGGFGVFEVPISYGFALGPHLAFGATLTGMVGRVYQTRVRLFDDPEKALETVPQNYQSSFNVGIDLGGSFRWDRFGIGLVARNINEPTFAGPTTNGEKAADVRVDTQITTTVAWSPWNSLLLLASADLLQTTTVLPGYDQQDISAGIEFEPWRALALRVGVSKNVAESDIPYIVTGGVGTRIGLVRIDLGGAAALVTDKVLNQRVPRQIGAGLAASATF